jgi:hypothetical protein
MGLFEWIRERRTGGDRRLREWRKAWMLASAEPTADQAQSLRARLDALGLSEEEIEIEREMLDALDAVVELSANVADTGLPTIATGHRIVGTDICHFTAPASMPDEPSQPSGRLILTSARALFVGGRGLTIPWHAVVQAGHTNRDLLLVRHGNASLYRFQCNTFADAMCAAFLARRLTAARRPHAPPV